MSYQDDYYKREQQRLDNQRYDNKLYQQRIDDIRYDDKRYQQRVDDQRYNDKRDEEKRAQQQHLNQQPYNSPPFGQSYAGKPLNTTTKQQAKSKGSGSLMSKVAKIGLFTAGGLILLAKGIEHFGQKSEEEMPKSEPNQEG